jgi:hypothetical protein
LETIVVPGLATIEILGSTVIIRLDEKYDGEVDLISHDIDDHLTDWEPGGIYYSTNKQDLPSVPDQEICLRIAKLLEAITERKRPNASRALRRLMEVLPEKHRNLQEFVRPGNTLSSKFCTWMLAPVKTTKEAPIQPVYSFGELKKRFSLKHYVFAIPMLIGTFLLIYLQTQVFSWMMYSPLTVTVEFSKKIDNSWIAIGGLVILVYLDNKLVRRSQKKVTSYSPYTYGWLNKAAINEEQAFREGSEGWTPWERFRSCLSFGLIHQPSLIYVFGMFLPHMIMGGVFMWVYLRTYRRTQRRRTAVLAASVFHRVYNRVALSVVIVSLFTIFGHSSFNWVTGVVGVIFTWTAMAVSNRRNSHSIKNAS